MTIDRLAATAVTLLFVPGDRPERFAKAAESGADLIIIDLEDAVAPEHKAAARQHAVDWLGDSRPAAVRINARQTPWFTKDLSAVTSAAGGHGVLMLPKCQSADDIKATRSVERSASPVIALIESAAGVRNAASISSADGVIRTAFGHIDFSAEVGVHPATREALLSARSAIVYAAAEAALPAPIDGVTTALDDAASLEQDCAYAKRMGFGAKLCIHPRQVANAAKFMAPTSDELEWARAVMRSAGTGVAVVDGHMVDAPVLAHARRLLGRA